MNLYRAEMTTIDGPYERLERRQVVAQDVASAVTLAQNQWPNLKVRSIIFEQSIDAVQRESITRRTK